MSKERTYIVQRPARVPADSQETPAVDASPAPDGPNAVAARSCAAATTDVTEMDRTPTLVRARRSNAEPGISLADELAKRTSRGVLVEPGPRAGQLRCVACAHRCVLEDGRTGACGVRFQRDGELRVPHGYVARKYVRSVETNTVFHVKPGARALTFGMFGCDLRCSYCHNWQVSQALREGVEGESPLDVSAEDLVREALDARCEVLCAAYNEPMISAEWAREVFARARDAGLVTALISDGNTTPEALAFMRPVTDVFRVDWKGWDNAQYHALGGRVGPVLEGIREAKRQGYWVEVVTLVVPAFNDALDGLRGMARALVEIDAEIPWHLNAFYPRYKLTDRPRMAGVGLAEAAGMAYARGLKFVYANNVADELRELSHTRCPNCASVLVERVNYETRVNRVQQGHCAQCGTRVPGVW